MRILKNKTASECEVVCGSKTVAIPANDQADLNEYFSQTELASSASLLALLGQGVDKYQLNDGGADLSLVDAVDLVRGYSQKSPTAADGKVYMSPDIWPLGTLTNFCGASDSISDGMSGTDPLAMESTQVEEKTKIIQFTKPVRLAGGYLQYYGAVLGDWLSFLVYVPATSGTSNPGHGSYAKTAIGGGVNLFLPYPNGGWDLNLAEKENSNVSFTKVRPVPAPGGDGFFDWNEETGEVMANAAQKGGYHLIDQDVSLNEFVTKIHIIGTDHFPLTIPAVRPVLMLPHWKCKITMKNSTAKTLQLTAMLYLGRANAL